MVYEFSILNDLGKTKIFYLSADSDHQLYKRVLNMYNVHKDKINIRRVYKESGMDLKLIKDLTDNKSDEIIAKVNSLFTKPTYKPEELKPTLISKGFSIKDILDKSELSEYVKKYSKVKLYWFKGAKRGSKNYFVAYKN